jgi:hypothetical protein
MRSDDSPHYQGGQRRSVIFPTASPFPAPTSTDPSKQPGSALACEALLMAMSDEAWTEDLRTGQPVESAYLDSTRRSKPKSDSDSQLQDTAIEHSAIPPAFASVHHCACFGEASPPCPNYLAALASARQARLAETTTALAWARQACLAGTGFGGQAAGGDPATGRLNASRRAGGRVR